VFEFVEDDISLAGFLRPAGAVPPSNRYCLCDMPDKRIFRRVPNAFCLSMQENRNSTREISAADKTRKSKNC